MIKNYLLPNKMKTWGWAILIPSLFFGVLFLTGVFSEPDFLNVEVLQILGPEKFLSNEIGLFKIKPNNIADELICIGMIIGGLLVAFSQQKEEDEYIAEIRSESLVKAVVFSYLILLLGVLFIYDMAFFQFMQLNMFTVLLFFIIRFNYKIWKLKRGIGHEE